MAPFGIMFTQSLARIWQCFYVSDDTESASLKSPVFTYQRGKLLVIGDFSDLIFAKPKNFRAEHITTLTSEFVKKHLELSVV
jgi:hypothetical protein